MTKLFRLTKHFIRGTIFRRFFFEKIKRQALIKEKKWVEFYASNQESIILNYLNGASLKLYKDSSLSPNLNRGDFEFHEIRFINDFLQHKDTFIDIGANIGYFSMIASKCVGDEGKIHSFEPTKKTYDRLLESIKLNQANNVSAHKIALSNISEEREFTISNDGFDAYNSLGKPSEGSDFIKEIVHTKPFDTVIEEKNISTPSLIKIDVEGWEMPVIEGMKNLLNKKDAPVLMVEFTEDNANLAGFSCSDLYDLISNFNYSMYKYNWVRNELVKQENKEYYTYTNLIAIKDNSPFFDRLKNVSIT